MTQRFLTTPSAASLVGLSTDTLREWTVRRGLIEPDVLPGGRGSPAKFSWQTVLVIRLARTLRQNFGIELQPLSEALTRLRQAFIGRSFPTLRDSRVGFLGSRVFRLIEAGAETPHGDCLILNLNPHLDAISVGFSLPSEHATGGQRELFTLPAARPVLERGHSTDVLRQVGS